MKQKSCGKYLFTKWLLFTLVLFMPAEYAVGQVFSHTIFDESTKKQAFKYRNDVSKEAKKVMKDWYRIGVLHSDWIENDNGKSIDLQGNELFPNLDYRNLIQIMLGVYMAENSNKKRGVVETSGRLLLPMKYDEIYCYPNQGFIKGVVGKYPENTVDYYSTDGFFLFTVRGINPNLLDDPTLCHYNFNTGVFEYKLGGEYHYKDAIGRELTSKYLPTDGMRLQRSDRENRELLARVAYSTNAWIKLATEAMGKGEYKKAWELLKIYNIFDMNGSDFAGTSVDLLYISVALQCAFSMRQYDLIVNGYSAAEPLTPWLGLTYYIDKDNTGQAVPSKWFNSFKDYYAASARSEMEQLVGVCCNIVNAAKRHMPSNMTSWNTTVNQVSQSVNLSASNVIVNFPGVAPEAGVYTGGTYESGNSMTSSNTSISTSNESSTSKTSDNAPNKVCSPCAGTGRCHACNGKGHYQPSIGSPEVKCSSCRQTGVCTLCKGTGKYGHIR